MAFAPEAVQSDHDLERRSAESAPTKEAAGPEASPVWGGFLSALGTDGSNGSNHRLLSNPVMRHPSSGEMRVLAMRRAQQGVGNHKTQRLVARLQRSSLVQRQCSCGGACESCQSKSSEALDETEETGVVQRQSAGASGAEAIVPHDVIPADSPGQQLDHETRGFMESRFGADFSDVRVHTDTRAAQSADALAANAYTTGRDIYFAAGKYAPGSHEGQHLLAHELTHTVQQGEGMAAAARVSTPEEPLEQQADETAKLVVSGAGLPDISPSGGLVARDAEKQPYDTSSALQKPTTGIKADAWVTKHAANVIGKVGYELSLAELALTTPFVAWKEGQKRQFLIDFWQPFWAGQGSAWAILNSALAPDRPERAVNSGRDVYPWDIGTDEWREPVVGELYKLFVKRLTESLGRIVPRWRSVKNQLALRLEGGDASADREPGQDEVFASHPIDTYVIGALPGKVEVNFKEYRKTFPEAAAKREIRSGLRPVTFDFQMASGAWNWIRVESPVDATPEEVAKTLYGTETKAYLLTAAPPLFGYDEINALLPVHQKKYNEEGLKAKTDPTPAPWMYDPTPAQQVLAGPLADEAALLQARKIKPAPTTDPASVLDRMRAIVRTIDRMRLEVTHVGIPGGLGSEGLQPVRDRVDQRSAKLAAATEGEVREWDAQSRGQLEVVNAAESGVLMAGQQQKVFEAWPSVKNVVSYVSYAYTRAAENSDLYDTGRYWLNIAEDQLRLLPVTLMDFLLAELRSAIQEASPEKMGIETEESHRRRYDIGGMEKREQKLREALVKVRDVVLQHPEQAKAALEPLFKEISDLQIEITLVTNMDECDRAWRALYDSLSFTGEIRAIWGGGNAIISDALDSALAMNQEWRAIYSDYKSGDEKTKEDAKKRLKEKAASEKWTGYMQSIREILQDQAKYDKWTTFALLVGIAIVTGGVGAYVEAAAGAAWGATAGFLTATVAEAATFTTLSYAVVAKDPSVKGFFEDFGKNLLTFGALRVVSRLYRLGVGLETAASLEGKAGEVLTQFALQNGEALYAADQEKRKRTGTGLTASEVGEISLNSMAFVAAVSIGSSLSKSWLTEMQLTGELHGNLINIESTRTKLVTLAEQVKVQQGKNPTLAREMLAKQAELLKLEEKSLTRLEELASDPKAAAAAGLTRSQIDKLGKARGEFVDALAQLQRARVASQLEVVGPNDFLAPQGDFFDGLKKFFTDSLHATVNDNIPPDSVTQARTIEVTPTEGTPFRVTERISTTASEVGKAVETVPEGEEIEVEPNLETEEKEDAPPVGTDPAAPEPLPRKPASKPAWPPSKPGSPKPKITDPDGAEWRYQRYAYKKYLAKKALADIEGPDVWYEKRFLPAYNGKRPGRSGGKAQVGAKNQLKAEGILQTENVELGGRYPDGVRGTKNAAGGQDYFEVGTMLKSGIPEARERIKLADEIKALGENDTVTFVDKADISNRITYRRGDLLTKTTSGK
jgi:hypothetical protein